MQVMLLLVLFCMLLLACQCFEALNQSMAAVSTGGFSTLPDGIAPYDNHMFYIVTIVLMFLGSLGFGTHILLLRGRFKRFF